MPQRFNHMELTYEKGALGPKLRRQIAHFYEEVFGWEAVDIDILAQQALLLRVDEDASQFILLAEGRNAIHSPGWDHLGIVLDTRAEVGRDPRGLHEVAGAGRACADQALRRSAPG